MSLSSQLIHCPLVNACKRRHISSGRAVPGSKKCTLRFPFSISASNLSSDTTSRQPIRLQPLINLSTETLQCTSPPSCTVVKVRPRATESHHVFFSQQCTASIFASIFSRQVNLELRGGQITDGEKSNDAFRVYSE